MVGAARMKMLSPVRRLSLSLDPSRAGPGQHQTKVSSSLAWIDVVVRCQPGDQTIHDDMGRQLVWPDERIVLYLNPQPIRWPRIGSARSFIASLSDWGD